MALKIKELTPKDSIQLTKELLKTKTNVKKKLKPGNLLMLAYNAKDQTQTYDKTPLVLVLRASKGYMLGLNFHWLPVPLRVVLIKKIFSMNTKQIKNNVPLIFSYNDLKPFLVKLGYAPVIRLYIRNRISSTGVLIPPEQLMNVARIKSESFTQGKVSAEQLYRKALKKNKEYRLARKRKN